MWSYDSSGNLVETPSVPNYQNWQIQPYQGYVTNDEGSVVPNPATATQFPNLFPKPAPSPTVPSFNPGAPTPYYPPTPGLPPDDGRMHFNSPSSIFDPSTLSDKDLEEQFNSLRAPGATSRNLMRRMGLDISNPFAARTASTLEQLARMSNYSQIIRGQFPNAKAQASPENLRNLLQSMITQAQSGNFLQYPNWNAPAGAVGKDAQGLMGELASMAVQARDKPENLNAEQLGFAGRFDADAAGNYNENDIMGLLRAIMGGGVTNPFGDFLQGKGLERQLQNWEDYAAAGNQGRRLLEYLTGSIK